MTCSMRCTASGPDCSDPDDIAGAQEEGDTPEECASWIAERYGHEKITPC